MSMTKSFKWGAEGMESGEWYSETFFSENVVQFALWCDIMKHLNTLCQFIFKTNIKEMSYLEETINKSEWF